MGAVFKFAFPHTGKKVEVFINRAVAVWALCAGFGQGSSVFSCLFGA